MGQVVYKDKVWMKKIFLHLTHQTKSKYSLQGKQKNKRKKKKKKQLSTWKSGIKKLQLPECRLRKWKTVIFNLYKVKRTYSISVLNKEDTSVPQSILLSQEFNFPESKELKILMNLLTKRRKCLWLNTLAIKSKTKSKKSNRLKIEKDLHFKTLQHSLKKTILNWWISLKRIIWLLKIKLEKQN